jgi:hypothetical protein
VFTVAFVVFSTFFTSPTFNVQARSFVLAMLLCSTLALGCVSCVNPFAPRLLQGGGAAALLGDQRTAEGVFQSFRYAYIFKDTLTYGGLLANDFAFVYRNYERNVDVSWGRDEEMMTTNGLFRTAQALDLVWNEVITSIGDSLTSDVSRGFTLTVTFNPSDVIRLDGRVNLRLVRQSSQEAWKIRRWRDESNF